MGVLVGAGMGAWGRGRGDGHDMSKCISEPEG